MRPRRSLPYGEMIMTPCTLLTAQILISAKAKNQRRLPKPASKFWYVTHVPQKQREDGQG